MQYTKWENLIVNIADLNVDDIHVETENHLKSSFPFHLLLTFVHVKQVSPSIHKELKIQPMGI